MSEFTKSLVVTPLADGNSWVLHNNIGYYVGRSPREQLVEVPVGFVTDFNTLPCVFRWFFNNGGLHCNALVVHDWLYWQQSTRSGYSREEADQILLDGLVVLGVSRFTRVSIYWAVRLFGDLAWYRNKWDRADGFKRVLDRLPDKYCDRIRRPSLLKRLIQQFERQI